MGEVKQTALLQHDIQTWLISEIGVGEYSFDLEHEKREKRKKIQNKSQ